MFCTLNSHVCKTDVLRIEGVGETEEGRRWKGRWEWQAHSVKLYRNALCFLSDFLLF